MSKPRQIIGGEPPKVLEEGEVVVGKLVGIAEGQFSRIYSVEVGNGKVVRFYGSALLDRHVDSTLIGRSLRFHYTGMSKSKQGRFYKNWEVTIWEE